MYLNHPADALKTIKFRQEFGNPNRLPLDVWFEGLEPKQDLNFKDSEGKPHHMNILDISDPDEEGIATVRYVLDDETFTYQVKVAESLGVKAESIEKADPGNPCQVGSPSNGDLWAVYVRPGVVVRKGEEIFNISIMKQEKAVFAPVDGMVKRVLKFADFKTDKKMAPVVEGELIVELGPMQEMCAGCDNPLIAENFLFCPNCGDRIERGGLN